MPLPVIKTKVLMFSYLLYETVGEVVYLTECPWGQVFQMNKPVCGRLFPHKYREPRVATYVDEKNTIKHFSKCLSQKGELPWGTLVLLFGKVSLKSLVGRRWGGGSVERWDLEKGFMFLQWAHLWPWEQLPHVCSPVGMSELITE